MKIMKKEVFSENVIREFINEAMDSRMCSVFNEDETFEVRKQDMYISIHFHGMMVIQADVENKIVYYTNIVTPLELSIARNFLKVVGIDTFKIVLNEFNIYEAVYIDI